MNNPRPSSPVGIRNLSTNGFGFDYDPLPPDSVIRFQLDDDNYLDLELQDGELNIHHGGLRGELAVKPVASNVIRITLIRR